MIRSIATSTTWSLQVSGSQPQIISCLITNCVHPYFVNCHKNEQSFASFQGKRHIITCAPEMGFGEHMERLLNARQTLDVFVGLGSWEQRVQPISLLYKMSTSLCRQYIFNSMLGMAGKRMKWSTSGSQILHDRRYKLNCSWEFQRSAFYLVWHCTWSPAISSLLSWVLH